MRPSTTTGERVLRASAFALVVVTVAVAAHWLGSAMVPRPAVVLASGCALAPVGWWVGARSRGRGVLVPLTVVTQLALHAAFAMSMGGMRASALLCRPPHLAGWHALRLTAGAASRSAQPPVPMHMTGSSAPDGLWMLLGHLGAAALVGLWLREGEQVLDLILTVLPALFGWRRVAALLRIFPVAQRPVGAGHATPTVRFRPGCTREAYGLRGPPAAHAA